MSASFQSHVSILYMCSLPTPAPHPFKKLKVCLSFECTLTFQQDVVEAQMLQRALSGVHSSLQSFSWGRPICVWVQNCISCIMRCVWERSGSGRKKWKSTWSMYVFLYIYISCMSDYIYFSSSYHSHHQAHERQTNDSSLNSLCLNKSLMVASYASAGCNCIVCYGDKCIIWLQLYSLQVSIKIV